MQMELPVAGKMAKSVSTRIRQLRQIFPDLYEENKPRIVRLCSRMVGVDNAEDLAQDSFIRAWTYLHQFKGQSSFATWVYQIALNTCRMYLRKKRLEMQPLENEHGEPVTPAVDHREDPYLRITRIHVADTLKETKPEDRNLIVDQYFEGFTVEEIAIKVGASLPATKARLWRAKYRFRLALEKK